MQIFFNLILTSIVAMAVEKYGAKYLLVEIDDEGPKASSRDDDEKLCQSKFELSKKRVNEFQVLIVTCPKLKDPLEYGNFISFHIDTGTLVLNEVWMQRCAQYECRCKAVFERILNRYKDDVNAVEAIFNAGDRDGNPPRIDNTFLERCRCFLGTSARQGFEYVKMNLPGPSNRCTEKKRISKSKSSPDHYEKVCLKLDSQGCYGLVGRILKNKNVE